MKNNLFKKLMALLLCLLTITSILSVAVFAEESSSTASSVSGTSDSSGDESEEDIWVKLKPAYMDTSFQSIDDRINGNDALASMTLMLVKDGFALYADTLTGEVVLLELSDPDENGEYEISDNGIYKYDGYFSTNPYNIGSSQSVGGQKSSNAIKEELYSQVIIAYTQNDTEQEFFSFPDAAVNNQITVKNIRSGIRVEYTLGREEIEYMVPRLIRREKLDALEEQIKANAQSERDARVFKAYYVLYDVNDPLKPKKTIEEYKAAFPISERFAVYVCDPAITPKELTRVEKILKLNTDYSFDQLDLDHAETEYEASDEAPPLFKLAIEYTIDELGLSVRCNAGNIRFDSSSYKLSNVTLLPYAGAGNTNNDGYIFTPDGSGTLIEFKNIRNQSFTTISTLYGQDYALNDVKGAKKEVMHLPVFGEVEIVKDQYSTIETVPKLDEDGNYLLDEQGNVITEDKKVMHDLRIGYLAVIEEGDSLTDITVENGGSTHMFASVFTSFNPRPKDSYTLEGSLSASSNAMWTVESKRKYTGDYKLRYFILTDDISYSGMAKVYRDYLIKKGDLTEINSTGDEKSDDIPLYIETLGSLEVMRDILGIPVVRSIALTDFESTKKMLEDLREKAGISNVKIKMSGWANEGLIPLAPTQVDIEDVLGGEEGFKSLLQYAKEKGVTLFPDFDYAYVSKDKAGDGFVSSKDRSKTINDQPADRKIYDPTWQGYITARQGVVSPNVMSRMYSDMYKEYSGYDVGSISVGTLGESLSSDFNEDDPLHREDSVILITRLFDQIKKDNGKVMVSGGNSYVFQYVTDIVDLPLDDSQYRHSSGSIPFMGMVLHGYIEYSGKAINLAGDYQYTLLKTIENGASPYFVIAIDNTAELKNYSSYSQLSGYYSVKYSIWAQDMVQTYKELNTALRDLKYSKMVYHEFLDEKNKVVKVVYDNGASFYINYLLEDYEVKVGNQTEIIPAESFLKFDGSGNKVIG
ncbi:MAG: DUF5696 domain-containing protein [Eubacteriales bacterium]|nr:DUF5696 domain-containing protein [Eubacteriales bacterium]